MKELVKQIIERYIFLINNNEFDSFFEKVQHDYIPQTTNDVAVVLEGCGIQPIPHMTFIPEGYYMVNKMTSYTTPKNIVRICYKAFSYCDIETLHITENVYDINEEAFEGCDFLTKVIIDEGCQFIDDGAFYACEGLEDVTLPKSLESIGYNLFNRCYQLTEIKYNGTTQEWRNIRNNEHITDGSYIKKIICSDGHISLENERG